MSELPAFVTKNTHAEELHQFIHTITCKTETLLKTSRKLTNDEVSVLAAQGNSAESWETISVAVGFTPAPIHNNHFFGACYLGGFDPALKNSSSMLSLPQGIYDSTLSNAIVESNCSIWKCSFIDRYFIDSNTLLFMNGCIASSTGTTFGNNIDLVIGSETGGREIPLFAEMSVQTATFVAGNRSVLPAFRKSIDTYTAPLTSLRGIVGRNCCISNCATIHNALILPAVTIEAVTNLDNVTILSSNEEPTKILGGSIVRNSCIQWGCSVDSMAIVDHALLGEHAHVERHGKVTHSIIGPNTGIAEGEVTSCLVGPFVGFHHQALLIGTLWPEGKGNVAYGANVGSNHTSKAPDQELMAGEGLFFGLGTSIKFPADFSSAPYSIIATGVITLPQRMAFPFSLINTPSTSEAGLSPAINELIPGWVLSDNLYLLKRNEAKFAARNRATRQQINAAIFRPDIISMMLAARNALAKAPVNKPLLLESDVPGIGKNYITRQSMLKAIDTYALHIEYFCLQQFFASLCAPDKSGQNSAALFSSPITNSSWAFAQGIIAEESYSWHSAFGALDRLAALTRQLHHAIVVSKEKDNIRGRIIIRDYDAVHEPIASDPFFQKLDAATSDYLHCIEVLKNSSTDHPLTIKGRSLLSF